MSAALNSPVTEKKDMQAVARRHRALAIQKLFENIGVRIFLVAMSLLFLVPLYWMVVTALKPNVELSTFPPTLWPRDIQWGNFAKAYNFIPFAQYFFNTVVITVFHVIGTVVSNMLVAYGFSCIKWPGRDKVFYIIIATIFIPFPVAAVPLFDLFAWLHWVNTFLPLTVPNFFASAFSVFLLRQFLMQVPVEMLEAARIDGANELQILWRVVFPVARPAVAVAALFAAIAAWNDFMGPLIYLQDDALRTLAVGLQFFKSTNDVQFNLLMAAALMSVLPVIILFFAFQRFFVKGITLGSVR